jgi:(R,R)-butanediol dehydrogenase/meso-butanediol dehydrogenase/diacetyl reductase
MLALRLYGVKDARLEQVDEPVVAPGTVKLRIEWAGVCGSDLHFYTGGPSVPAEQEHPLFHEQGPHIMGHEFSGTVTELGDGVTGLSIGDLVAVRPNVWDGTCEACLRGEPNLCDNRGNIGYDGGGGGFSEFVVAPQENVYKLPPSFDAKLGALVESLTVAWRPVRKSGAKKGTTALVIGAGPIGLGLLLCLKAVGVEQIIVSEPGASRAALAKKLGADVINPMTTDVAKYAIEATGGKGVDVAFDASGFDENTLPSAFGAIRVAGTVVVVARFHGIVPMDPKDFLFGEKTITGSYSYTDQDFREVIEAIDSGRLDPMPLVSSTIGLDEVMTRGIEHLLGDGRATEVKILVSPALHA